MALPTFNDYLVFVDEAGDHLLKSHYPDFPLFVLAFCVVERNHYANFIVPQLLNIKLKYFSDPHVIFHERDIRKHTGDFNFLTDPVLRDMFFEDINNFMEQAEFYVIASVIQKELLQVNFTSPENPYTLGVRFGIEGLVDFLDCRGQKERVTVAFEARGKKEDQELELAWLRLMQSSNYSERFDIKILPKISNCSGLQLADLIARPIGRYTLNPLQPNRAYNIIKNKMKKRSNKMDTYSFKIFPSLVSDE